MLAALPYNLSGRGGGPSLAMVIFQSTDGTLPGNQGTIDYIERGDGQGSSGDGNVFISHESYSTEVRRTSPWVRYSGGPVVHDYDNCPIVSTNSIWDVNPGDWRIYDERLCFYTNSEFFFEVRCIAKSDWGYWYVLVNSYPRSQSGLGGVLNWDDWSMSGNWPISEPFSSIWPKIVARLNTHIYRGNDNWSLCYLCDFVETQPVVNSLSRGEYSFWKFSDFGCGGLHTDMAIHKGGFTKAFYNAVDKLPQAKQNTLANIAEVLSALSSFREGYKGITSAATSLKHIAQESWLAYRYSYKTTVSDIQEMASLLSRLASLTHGSIMSYGQARDRDVIYYAAIEVPLVDLLPSDVRSACKTLGARVSLANVWDMIPYSFVVDWFFQISNLLESIDAWLQTSELTFSKVWYSFKSVYPDSPSTSAYGRWLGNPPSLPYVSYQSASERTIIMRVADTLALFF